MTQRFIYGLKDKVTAAGIVAVLLSVTTFMMPHLQATLRNNRVFGLGVVCCAVMSLLMLRFTLTGFLLLGYVTVSLWFSASETVGSAMYQILCFSGLWLLALATYHRWSHYRGWIYNAVCLIALANVAAQIIQVCGVSFPRGLLPYAQYGFVGLMANVNETSALLAICLPFFFRRRWAYLIPAVVAGLALARTTNGVLAATVVSAIWLIMTRRRWAVVALAYAAIFAFGAFFCLSVDPFSFGNQSRGRGLVYKVTAQAATVKPFGWEFGQFDYVVPLLTHTGTLRERNGDKVKPLIEYLFQGVADKEALDRATVRVTGQTDPYKIRDYLQAGENNTTAMFVQAHSDYLEFWFATGYAGIILVLAFLWRSLARGFRKRDKLPAYALLASSLTALFFFPWQIVPIAALTATCLLFCNVKEVSGNEIHQVS